MDAPRCPEHPRGPLTDAPSTSRGVPVDLFLDLMQCWKCNARNAMLEMQCWKRKQPNPENLQMFTGLQRERDFFESAKGNPRPSEAVLRCARAEKLTLFTNVHWSAAKT